MADPVTLVSEGVFRPYLRVLPARAKQTIQLKVTACPVQTFLRFVDALFFSLLFGVS